MVELPYEKDFVKINIPTKVHPIQKNKKLLEFYKKEIQSLLKSRFIRFSKSIWSYVAFYVYNQVENEHDVPGSVINYKPFNNVFRWIRYLIPNKKELLERLYGEKIFSKFHMKSGFQKIQIDEKDRYKTAFIIPWNVKPSKLKITSEFQHVLNNYSEFSKFYFDNALTYSKFIDQHFKHIKAFFNLFKRK